MFMHFQRSIIFTAKKCIKLNFQKEAAFDLFAIVSEDMLIVVITIKNFTFILRAKLTIHQ